MEKTVLHIVWVAVILLNFFFASSFFGSLYAANQTDFNPQTSPFLKLLPVSAPFYQPLLSPFPSPIPVATTDGLHILKKRDDASIIALINAQNKDVAPPTITVTAEGSSGYNGWYTSDTTVSLDADDSFGSGIAKIEYSFDGKTFLSYTDPVTITKNGLTTLTSRAVDNIGNVGVSPLPTLIKISKQSPEASALFDLGTKKFEFSAVSQNDIRVSLNQSDSDLTLQDEAGNQTALTYAATSEAHQANLSIKSIQYSTDAMVHYQQAILSVIFGIDHVTGQTIPLFQKVTLDSTTTTIAVYDSKHDATTIEQYQGDTTTTTIVPGVTLLKLSSSHGQIVVGY